MPKRTSDPTYLANRAALLADNPLCHWCKRAPATEADHLIEHDRGGTNDIDNLSQSLQQTLSQLLTSVLTVLAVLSMMIWISPLLALIVLEAALLAMPFAGDMADRIQANSGGGASYALAAGAANAALFAIALLAHDHPAWARQLAEFRQAQTEQARAMRVPPAVG